MKISLCRYKCLNDVLSGLLGSSIACPVAIEIKRFFPEGGADFHVPPLLIIVLLAQVYSIAITITYIYREKDTHTHRHKNGDILTRMYRAQQLELERLRKAQRRVGDFNHQ